jgi:hypothetical protein
VLGARPDLNRSSGSRTRTPDAVNEDACSTIESAVADLPMR